MKWCHGAGVVAIIFKNKWHTNANIDASIAFMSKRGAGQTRTALGQWSVSKTNGAVLRYVYNWEPTDITWEVLRTSLEIIHSVLG